ncbi:MAG: undecaprenyl-diphosphate phosphatase [Alphaproteobacteria bacterium GM202ARS2]|nr:undecaprenyl-diphosphate phosphatase [Alphaproteobacteria bacterium GM202ARS2]
MPPETAPSLFYIMVLAIIQGLSEFLPISSSAHLVLLGILTDTQHSIDVDIAVHFGSLLALMLFCRKDIGGLITDLPTLVTHRRTQYTSLLRLLVIASLPVVVIGFVVRYSIDMSSIRSLAWLASVNLLFAVLLYGADRWGRTDKTLADLRWWHGLAIGSAQACALMPGVSRSGAVITAARHIGVPAEQAARLSFLLSMPAIAGAMLLVAIDATKETTTTPPETLLIAILLSFVAAFGALKALMSLLRITNFTPFVLYRVGLSLLLFASLS